MKSCQSRLATAALLSLVSTVLAGCGQTGPLYMPSDEAARERYDPGNAYGLPPINRHQANEQKQQENAQGHTHRHHHGHGDSPQTIPAPSTSATENAVHDTSVPANKASSASGITSAAAGTGAAEASGGISSASAGTVPVTQGESTTAQKAQSAANTPAAHTAPLTPSATPAYTHTGVTTENPAAAHTGAVKGNDSTGKQPASSASSAHSSNTSPWQGVQFTPYSVSTEGSGLNIQSGTPNSQ